MDAKQLYIVGILVVTLVCFVWGRWRYDVVALACLMACGILNLIPTPQLFYGFGHPATITVIFVLVLSHGLNKSGAIEKLATLLNPLSLRPLLYFCLLLLLALTLSMFINNVGALALLMPIALQTVATQKQSASTILMPLSFASILGGMVTLIGTPPNIIISTYRAKTIGEPFHMFDFTPVGGITALACLIFIIIFSRWLVPKRTGSAENTTFEIESYLFEIKALANSPFIGKKIGDIEKIIESAELELIALIHKSNYNATPHKSHLLLKSDLLILKGSQTEINAICNAHNLALMSAENMRTAIRNSTFTQMVEIVITPGSELEGQTVDQIKFKQSMGINLLALSREGKRLRGRLRNTQLKIGDVLLIQGSPENLELAISKIGGLPLADRGLHFITNQHPYITMGLFFGAILLTITEVLPIQQSFGIAIIGMVLFGALPLKELYKGISWPVVVLLGAMIPVGQALETSGTTKLIASSLLNLTIDVPIWATLLGTLIVTMTLSDILNNATTAILMAPIAKTLAEKLSVNPDAFLMAVAIGASCAFLTPIGHQNNALIMGPGGYHFKDYWKMGLPLEILICCVSLPLILYFWPL